MLKYSQGLAYDLAPITNQDHFSLNGFPEQRSRHVSDRLQGSRSNRPRTFWKSPYTGNNSIFQSGFSGNKNTYLKPELKTETSPVRSRTHSREGSGTVRGILKNKYGDASNCDVTVSEEPVQEAQYRTLNLITTGTDDVRPHGTRPESKSAGKRVQFNNLPKATQKSKNNFLNLPIGTATSQRGRRLYFNRTVAVRVLGTPNHCDKYGGPGRLSGPGGEKYVATTSLGGGESYIKSQINDFVKKLRLAESAKLARNDSAKQRVGGRYRCADESDKWREFDLERPVTASEKTENAQNDDNGYSDDDVAESASVSLENIGSPPNTNIAESTPGGAEVYRRRTPMAALFVKYRHITNNKPDLRRYDKRSVISETATDGSTGKSTNFCDNDKTSQILGWLEDMQSAKGSGDGVKSTINGIPNTDADNDAVTRVARANTATRVTKDATQTEPL